MNAEIPVQRLRDNLQRVRETVQQACARAGRSPDSVCLVAVTKYVEPAVIRALLAAGATEIGENRVQQLSARATELGARHGPWRDPSEIATAPPDPLPRWHMIGNLQRNKVKALLPHARIIHSLDSIRLADELARAAAAAGTVVDAFIEVNVAGEASKSGLPPAELPALVDAVQGAPPLRLRGLMTMPPFDLDPEEARPHFARLRRLLEDLQARRAVGPECVHLSMGMSLDYAVAIEEGATFIRVGSALFDGLSPGETP
ncbi:MAG: YggS family pyridoxal phosphate-dependent enzyme [Phycisphaerae bacterium]